MDPQFEVPVSHIKGRPLTKHLFEVQDYPAKGYAFQMTETKQLDLISGEVYKVSLTMLLQKARIRFLKYYEIASLAIILQFRVCKNCLQDMLFSFPSDFFKMFCEMNFSLTRKNFNYLQFKLKIIEFREMGL